MPHIEITKAVARMPHIGGRGAMPGRSGLATVAMRRLLLTIGLTAAGQANAWPQWPSARGEGGRGHYCSSQSTCVHAGFCTDVAHSETRPAQPADQHERWDIPYLNATHLVIRWAPGAALCTQTIDRYDVSLNSSSRVFNMVLKAFGTFPQNACAADSPARAQATLGDGRKAVSPCGTYPRRCSRTFTETIIEMKPYQWQAFGWAPVNLTVQASAHGTLRQGFGRSGKRVPLWCISFRKYDPRLGGPAGSPAELVPSLYAAYESAQALVLHAASTLASVSSILLAMLFTPAELPCSAAGNSGVKR
ncbi:hypothetical protein T492DRAFT_1038571 [Pavlovales sp. CCMP2436]|nr:hypothetical protein T492DRAFT_1038571 [Pavlovales sp. CCMP2436]